MAELVSAQCGFCRKNFKLRPDQLGRQVHCPHCKTAVIIPVKTEVAQEMVRALGGPVSPRDSLLTRHSSRPVRAGLRSKSVAIVWVAILAVVAVGMLIFVAFKVMSDRAKEEQAAGQGKPGFVTIPPIGGKLGAKTAEPEVAVVKPAPDVVEVEKLLWGYKDQTRTYVCGKVTNLTDKPIRAMTITIPVLDKAKAPLGDATAILRDLPPGKTAPLVAVLDHAQGAEVGGHGEAGYQINPPGLAKPPAAIELDDVPWAIDDTKNELMSSGTISQGIFNRGVTAFSSVEISAIMRDEQGKIIGATKGTVPLARKLGKDGNVNVKIPYEHCPASKIRNTETWVQVAD